MAEKSKRGRFRNPVTYAEKVFESAVVEVRRKGKKILSRPDQAWRLAQLEPVRQPESPCFLCLGVEFWSRGERGPWICRRCHPPVEGRQVVGYEVPF